MVYSSRWLLVRTCCEAWYRREFLSRVSPVTLAALLFTIVIMFSLKGDIIVGFPLAVLQVAVPLVIYFATLPSKLAAEGQAGS